MVASKNKKKAKAVKTISKNKKVVSKTAAKVVKAKKASASKKTTPKASKTKKPLVKAAAKKAIPSKKIVHSNTKPVAKKAAKVVATQKIVAAKHETKHVAKQHKHIEKSVAKAAVVNQKETGKVKEISKNKVIVTSKPSKPVSTAPKKCKKALCKEMAILNGYCRLHYVANWKLENIDKKVKRLQQLDKFISEIKKRFPAEYIDLIKDDLTSDKVFKNVLVDMDLEEDINNFEQDDETQKVVTAYSNMSAATTPHNDDDDF